MNRTLFRNNLIDGRAGSLPWVQGIPENERLKERAKKAKDAPCLVYFATDEGRVVAGMGEARVRTWLHAPIASRTEKE